MSFPTQISNFWDTTCTGTQLLTGQHPVGVLQFLNLLGCGHLGGSGDPQPARYGVYQERPSWLQRRVHTQVRSGPGRSTAGPGTACTMSDPRGCTPGQVRSGQVRSDPQPAPVRSVPGAALVGCNTGQVRSGQVRSHPQPASVRSVP